MEICMVLSFPTRFSVVIFPSAPPYPGRYVNESQQANQVCMVLTTRERLLVSLAFHLWEASWFVVGF